MRRIIAIIVVFSSLFTFPKLEGQSNKWEANILLGGANYQGDLVQSKAPILSETNPAIGASLRYILSRSFKIRGDILYGTISGNDQNNSDLQIRNFSFRSNIFESGLALEWSPFATIIDEEGNESLRKIAPYVFLGTSFYNVNATNSFQTGIGNGFSSKIEKDRQTSFPRSGLAFPNWWGAEFQLK